MLATRISSGCNKPRPIDALPLQTQADKAVAAGEITRLQNSAAKMTNGRDKRTLLKTIRLLISATPGVEPFVECMQSFVRAVRRRAGRAWGNWAAGRAASAPAARPRAAAGRHGAAALRV